MSDITVNGIKVTAAEALALVRAQAEIAAREAREAAQAVALAAAMADLDAECAAEDRALSARLLAEAETEARLARETCPWGCGGFVDADSQCLSYRGELVEAPAVECLGHPAGSFDAMGETVYCDGSCREGR